MPIMISNETHAIALTQSAMAISQIADCQYGAQDMQDENDQAVVTAARHAICSPVSVTVPERP